MDILDDQTIGWKELESASFLWAHMATLGCEWLVLRGPWREVTCQVLSRQPCFLKQEGLGIMETSKVYWE